MHVLAPKAHEWLLVDALGGSVAHTYQLGGVLGTYVLCATLFVCCLGVKNKKGSCIATRALRYADRFLDCHTCFWSGVAAFAVQNHVVVRLGASQVLTTEIIASRFLFLFCVLTCCCHISEFFCSQSHLHHLAVTSRSSHFGIMKLYALASSQKSESPSHHV